jgi:hypothetical protein
MRLLLEQPLRTEVTIIGFHQKYGNHSVAIKGKIKLLSTYIYRTSELHLEIFGIFCYFAYLLEISYEVWMNNVNKLYKCLKNTKLSM